MSNTIHYSLMSIDCRDTYYSAAYTAQCGTGYKGDSVYVAEGVFVSRDSQEEADALAQAYAEGQLVCTPMFFQDFIGSARQATPSPELFTLPNGVNEFDLLFVDGEYHLFYTKLLATAHRQAATVPLLQSAADDATIPWRYPTAIYDSGVWNVWTTDDSIQSTKRYISSSMSEAFVDSGDVFPPNISDFHVRKLSNGGFIAAYKHLGTLKVGVMTAEAVSGPWTDRGYLLDGIDRPSWLASEEADPSTFEYGGRLYCPFAAFDGVVQRLAIVEISKTTFRAIAQPVSIQSPTEPWMQTGGSFKIFNPVFLTDRIYFAHNTNSTTEAGWAYLVLPEHPVADGRTNAHAILVDAASASDLATGIPLALHGTATCTGEGVSVLSGTGGAYGFLNYTSVTDFTLHVRFTPSSVTGDYQLIFRASGYSTAIDPVIGVWVSPVGAVHVEIHSEDSVGNLNMDVGSVLTGVSNTLTVQKASGSVAVTLNESTTGSGTHSTAISGLAEWSILNNRGRSSTSSQQMLGVVHEAYLTIQ